LYLMWQARRMETGPERSKQLAAARQHLEAVQRQRPSWASVYLARAELSELLGKPDQAIKDYQESLKNGETSPTVTRRLVSLLAQQGRDSEAQFLLARLHQSYLQGNELGKVAVAMAIRRGETGQAVEMMRRAVREDSSSSQDQLWMARVLASAGPSYAVDAEKRLKAALELNPKDPESYLAISQLLLSQRRRDEALSWMEKAKQNLPPDQLPLVLAAIHENLGEFSKAMAFYSEAIQKNPDDLKTLRVVVNAHLLGNRVREAEPLLRKMVEGKMATTPADREWARRGLAQILGASNNFARYVEALQLLGIKVDAEGRLPRELPTPENSEDRRALARILAQGNQKVYRQNAIRLFEEMFREKSLTSEDEFTLSMLYEAEGDIRKAQDKLRNLVQPQVRTPQYLAQYTMSLILQQRQPDALDEAEKIIGWIEELERQRQSGPNSFASVELRARLLEARGKGDEAIKLLQMHTARNGASAEEILLVLASQTRLKRYADAFSLCESAWKEGKCRPDALASVSVSLLRVMSPSESQTAFIEERLKQSLGKAPDNQQIQLQLADLYDFMGQYEKAADSYRQVLKKAPDNIVALNNLAWLQAYQAGQVNQALEMINRAVQGAGRRADLLDTRAMVHLALKDTASALSDLKEANKEGDSPTRLFHLARVLHEDRDTSKAREILRQAKAKGFQLTQLHPVEQPEAQRLLKQYGIR
ncbi:MAG: tetratricopeptide repeat protein, partial [Gemmataceae bacterium]